MILKKIKTNLWQNQTSGSSKWQANSRQGWIIQWLLLLCSIIISHSFRVKIVHKHSVDQEHELYLVNSLPMNSTRKI